MRSSRRDGGVDLVGRDARRAVGRQPAAQHVVAVRRQPVAAADHRGHVAGCRRRRAAARGARGPDVDDAADRQRLVVEVQHAAVDRARATSGRRRSGCAARTARRWPGGDDPDARPPMSTYTASGPRCTTGTGRRARTAGARTRGGALTGITSPTLAGAITVWGCEVVPTPRTRERKC